MMNNFGMNPIGMNQMQVNNMGMMGMNNNQPNLMDQTALNIKNIIIPYENNIRELEEIIKQKDFEITVLKQKLNNNISNNNFMNMNPMNNMNMNPMMNININPMINMNMNPSLIKKEITIDIKSNINTTIKCYNDIKASSLKNELFLTYNYKPIYDKTLGECGISNGSIINLTDKVFNIQFKNNSGLIKVLNLDANCPLKKAIELYCKRINQEHLYQKLLDNQIRIDFLYNGYALNFRDEKPIRSIFSDDVNQLIVVDEFSIYGGNSK